MAFNVPKCNVLNVTHSKNPVLFNYNVNGDVLEIVNEIRDLGIIIDKTLSWKGHLNDIVTKSNRMLGLMKRTLGYNSSQKVKCKLYSSFVCSKLEYCTQVWGGLSKTNTDCEN